MIIVVDALTMTYLLALKSPLHLAHPSHIVKAKARKAKRPRLQPGEYSALYVFHSKNSSSYSTTLDSSTTSTSMIIDEETTRTSRLVHILHIFC